MFGSAVAISRAQISTAARLAEEAEIEGKTVQGAILENPAPRIVAFSLMVGKTREEAKPEDDLFLDWDGNVLPEEEIQKLAAAQFEQLLDTLAQMGEGDLTESETYTLPEETPIH